MFPPDRLFFPSAFFFSEPLPDWAPTTQIEMRVYLTPFEIISRYRSRTQQVSII